MFPWLQIILCFISTSRLQFIGETWSVCESKMHKQIPVWSFNNFVKILSQLHFFTQLIYFAKLFVSTRLRFRCDKQKTALSAIFHDALGVHSMIRDNELSHPLNSSRSRKSVSVLGRICIQNTLCLRVCNFMLECTNQQPFCEIDIRFDFIRDNFPHLELNFQSVLMNTIHLLYWLFNGNSKSHWIEIDSKLNLQFSWNLLS